MLGTFSSQKKALLKTLFIADFQVTLHVKKRFTDYLYIDAYYGCAPLHILFEIDFESTEIRLYEVVNGNLSVIHSEQEVIQLLLNKLSTKVVVGIDQGGGVR